MITEEIALYETWYDFKRELQRRSGVVLLNKTWFNVKPKEPLPWYNHQMRAALERLKTKPALSHMIYI
jgi:hypothetical protein